MKRLWLWMVLLVTVLTTAGWWFRRPALVWYHQNVKMPRIGNIDPKPRPDPQRYDVLSAELKRWRAELATRYESASTAEEKAAVEQDARILLEQSLPAMMRCWLGTPWDFHGTASKPGGGKIACGYFVSTVLRDAGFNVDRFKLAQQASGNILKTFVHKDNCHLTSSKPYEEFLIYIEDFEPGIYIIGLDTHVAFLVKEETGFRFIHSSGSKPWCVVDEDEDQAGVLKKSRWRMLGSLTGHQKAIRQWLSGKEIKVHTG